jgi:hypothetical protein
MPLPKKDDISCHYMVYHHNQLSLAVEELTIDEHITIIYGVEGPQDTILAHMHLHLVPNNTMFFVLVPNEATPVLVQTTMF